MKKNITGPLILAIFGLALLAMSSPLTYSHNPVAKYGALVLPMLVTLSGMTWLLIRLQSGPKE